jgi:hypothetical protein
MEPLQRAASCVTESVFRPSVNGYRGGSGHAMILNEGRPVRLRAAQPLLLFAQLEYDVVRTDDVNRGPWKVRTRGYRYHVLSVDEREVVLYHWHPGGASRYEDPHVHVGGSQLSHGAVLTGKTHLPGGRIAFEQVLTLLIQECDVVPLRDDHVDVLDDCFQRFAKWRTWT